MRFSAVTLLAMPLAALASPFVIEARAAPDNTQVIIANLTNVYNAVVAENKTLNGFGNNDKPTATQLIALQNGGNAIAKGLNDTIKSTVASAVVTSDESTTVYNKLNNQLLPATQQLLQNFINHYPGLKAAGVAGVVNSTLTQQKGLVQTLGNDLVAKSQGTAKTNGPALTQKFITAFNNAIAKYST